LSTAPGPAFRRIVTGNSVNNRAVTATDAAPSCRNHTVLGEKISILLYVANTSMFVAMETIKE
jgi:hypothetical protein